jgi:hypothetical protein
MIDFNAMLTKQRGPSAFDDFGPQFEDGQIVTRSKKRFSALLVNLIVVAVVAYLLWTVKDLENGKLPLFLVLFDAVVTLAVAINISWTFFGQRVLYIDGNWLVRSRRLAGIKIGWDMTFGRDKLSGLKVSERRTLYFFNNVPMARTVYAVTAWSEGNSCDLLKHLFSRDDALTVIALLREKFGIDSKGQQEIQRFD